MTDIYKNTFFPPAPSSSPRGRWRPGTCRTWSTSCTRPSGCRCRPWAGGSRPQQTLCARPSHTWSWTPARLCENYFRNCDFWGKSSTFSEPPWLSCHSPGGNYQRPALLVWAPPPPSSAWTPPPANISWPWMFLDWSHLYDGLQPGLLSELDLKSILKQKHFSGEWKWMNCQIIISKTWCCEWMRTGAPASHACPRSSPPPQTPRHRSRILKKDFFINWIY